MSHFPRHPPFTLPSQAPSTPLPTGHTSHQSTASAIVGMTSWPPNLAFGASVTSVLAKGWVSGGGVRALWRVNRLIEANEKQRSTTVNADKLVFVFIFVVAELWDTTGSRRSSTHIQLLFSWYSITFLTRHQWFRIFTDSPVTCLYKNLYMLHIRHLVDQMSMINLLSGHFISSHACSWTH